MIGYKTGRIKMLNSTKYCITMTQDCWYMFKTIHTNIVNKEFFYAKCSEAIFLFGGVFFIRFEESFVGTDIPHKWLLIWTCQKVINKDRIYQEIWKLSARWMSVFPEDWHRLTRGSLPVKVPPHIRKNAWRSFPRQIRQGQIYKRFKQYSVPGFAVMCRALWEERNNRARAPVEMLHLWVEWEGKKMQAPSQLCSDFRGKEKRLLHVQKRRLFIARKCLFCAFGQIASLSSLLQWLYLYHHSCNCRIFDT